MKFYKEDKDFYTTVVKSLNEIDPNWEQYGGLIIGGTHAPSNVDNKLAAIKKARENKIPFLGICFGMQLMVIEYARNVLGMIEADTMEMNPSTPLPVIVKMQGLRVGQLPADGGYESHWHNFKFNNQYLPFFQYNWTINYTEDVVESMRLSNHPHFKGVQYHPEYQSSKSNPHKVLKEFIQKCKEYSAVGQKV